jgi:carotenoid cleavage dioxygenase-like enzyme
MSAEGLLEPGRIWDAIVKADLDKRAISHSWSQEGCFPSEALFIPAPPQKDPTTQLPKDVDEDDGVLVSIVLDSIHNKSFLLVLDSKTFTEVAKADLPQVVPLSFAHGSFRGRL